MDVRDNMRTSISSSAENLAYKERMPNLPYMFADSANSLKLNSTSLPSIVT